MTRLKEKRAKEAAEKEPKKPEVKEEVKEEVKGKVPDGTVSTLVGMEIQQDINKTKEEPKKEVPKELGLKGSIQKLNDNLELLAQKDKKNKDKMFKLRWGIKSQLKNLAKKNKVLVFLLQINRNIKPVIAEIKDGLIIVGDKFHQCSMDFIYLLEGKTPTIVLLEWRLQPIGTKDYYDAVKNKTAGVEAETIIIRAIESNQNPPKKQIGGKSLIWIIIIGIAVAYVLFGQG